MFLEREKVEEYSLFSFNYLRDEIKRLFIFSNTAKAKTIRKSVIIYSTVAFLLVLITRSVESQFDISFGLPTPQLSGVLVKEVSK